LPALALAPDQHGRTLVQHDAEEQVQGQVQGNP
jgi:hypothetical protein